MSREHKYNTTIYWTGNKGSGTSDYKSYERSHSIEIDHKPNINGSSDPAFRGDKTCHNPEDLFLSSLSACHMLWYLHLCAVHKVVIMDYVDHALGMMMENEDGSGAFSEVTLNPVVTVLENEMKSKADTLHHQANKICYILYS